MNSQPLDYAPTIPKLDPNVLKLTMDTFTNKTKPETAMATTSDVTIDMNTIMQNGKKRRISGEGRKEEEMVCTLLGDMKEWEEDEKTGWEEEAMTRQHNQCDKIHDDDVDELGELEFSPNGREHKPQWLAYVGSGDRAGMPKEPKFNDDGDACGLKHATSSIVKPQTTLEAPHNALLPVMQCPA